MTGSEPQQDRSRATRQKLLETTVRCLATHGWAASTMSVIATECGISRGALQHHFPTREALIIAGLEHMFAERAAQIDAIQDPGGDGRERIHAIVSSVVDLVGGDLFKGALQVWAVAAADPELRATVVPLERRFARDAHERAVRLLGVDDSDPKMRSLVQATLDLARGLALADVLTDDSHRRAHVVRAWSDQLADALSASTR